MRGLWKISRRYMFTAVLATLFVIGVNFAVLLYWGYQAVGEDGSVSTNFGRRKMNAAAEEISLENGTYRMSPEGYRILGEGPFVWAMLIDGEGDVVWSHQLPEEIPLHYELADIAVMSRWYLKDYPVGVWKNSLGLMVYGYEKDSIARFNLISDMRMIDSLPGCLKGMLLLNGLLFLGLVLFLAWRFYRSLKPVEQGIVMLSAGERVELAERGSVKELARRLNQTSAALRQKDEKLKRRDDARTDWIAGVSHDIRTPLALITGYSDELMHDQRLSGEARWKAEAIRQQGLVLKELVENLNLASRLEYHSQPLRKTVFSPAEPLRECVAEYYNRGLRENYEICISIREEAEQRMICADRALLLRLFRNLIGNSIRHNPEGCRIRVSLRGAGDRVRYGFADSGPGIPGEIVEVLMGEAECGEETGAQEMAGQASGREEEAGAQAGAGQAAGREEEAGAQEVAGQAAECGEARSGTGAQPHIMGLRIACQIASAHGGALRFVRREGGGFDMEVELPVS